MTWKRFFPLQSSQKKSNMHKIRYRFSNHKHEKRVCTLSTLMTLSVARYFYCRTKRIATGFSTTVMQVFSNAETIMYRYNVLKRFYALCPFHVILIFFSKNGITHNSHSCINDRCFKYTLPVCYQFAVF